jgi:hypothetical protein
MTPSGIEPATFRFVAQNLNHCATAVPTVCIRAIKQYKLHRSGEKSRNIAILQRAKEHSIYNKAKDG